MDSAIDWKEKQLTKRVKFQSELTELKARDTSCPKGKKVELKKIITIEIWRDNEMNIKDFKWTREPDDYTLTDDKIEIIT